MGDISRSHFLGFIITGDSFMNRWKMIQSEEKGKLEFRFRWFRICKDVEMWCMKKNVAGNLGMMAPAHVINSTDYALQLEERFPDGEAFSL